MSLQITTQRAMIGIQTNPAKLTYETPQPLVEIKTTPGSINARHTNGQVRIDQSQCFSESGLKGPLELTRDNAAESVQIMYASIGRIVDQGNELANFHNGVHAIAEQGYYNAYQQFDKEFNLGTMPMSRPKIDFVGGEVTFNPVPTKVEFTPRLSRPNYHYTPGKVNVYMQQYPSIQIQASSGNHLNLLG